MAAPIDAMKTHGFVDAHSHLRATGLQEHGVPGKCLEEALLRMTAMSAVDAEDDAYVAACDLLASGVTAVQTVFHTFDAPESYLESVGALVRGVRRAGIRCLVILALTDVAEYLPWGITRPVTLPESIEPLRGIPPHVFPDVVRQARADHPDVPFGVGPVAPQWASDELLEVLGELAASGLRVHTHVLESERQRRWGPSPIERLDRHGLLGPRTSLAHCVWCEDAELDLLASNGVQLVTCPESNRLLGSGTAWVGAWLDAGIDVAVGLDSAVRRPQPWNAARLAMDSQAAERALTTGGVQATDLAAGDDQVIWRDRDEGIVERVVAQGSLVVDDGVLVHELEYRDARARIDASMDDDRVDREARQRSLDPLMTDYLRVIDASLHEG